MISHAPLLQSKTRRPGVSRPVRSDGLSMQPLSLYAALPVVVCKLSHSFVYCGTQFVKALSFFAYSLQYTRFCRCCPNLAFFFRRSPTTAVYRQKQLVMRGRYFSSLDVMNKAQVTTAVCLQSRSTGLSRAVLWWVPQE